MEKEIKKIRDKRKKRQIKIKDIIKLLMITDILGESSIRRKEYLGRQKGVKKLIGSKRKQVASDTTVHRVIREIPIEEMREVIIKISKGEVRKEVGIRLKRGKKVKVGVIDGSRFGRIYASVLMGLGEEVNWFIDAERQEKYGKELPTSLRMIKRIAKEYGRNEIRYIVGDGLYACQNFFNTCKEIGSYGIVKTKESGSLNIIKDAEEIIAIEPRDNESVKYVKGFDEVRGCSYEIWEVNELWMEGVKESLRVLKVRENQAKKDNIEEFYVITQAEDLLPEDLREIAHLRWQVENNGFKSLNEQCGSKKLLTKNPHERFLLLLIQLLSFNILQLYRKITTNKICKKIKFVILPPFYAIRQAFLLSLGVIEYGGFS